MNIWNISVFVLVLILSGCSTISLQEVSRQYYEGDAKKAYKLAKRGANLNNQSAQGDELLWQIQGGILGFDLHQAEAKTLLELAEKNININEVEGILTAFFESFGAILLNDNVMNYRGFLYEGVMVNYYKALLYMSEGNYADARVEFNRASDRQRRIKEYYDKEIARVEAKQQEAYHNQQNKGDPLRQKTQGDQILQSYSNLSRFASLNGYINPMIDYVSGIFFMLEGDRGKAIDFLKESYGISNAKIIKEDLERIQNGGYQEKYTWLIIEDGKSPLKIEKRFSIPIYTGSSLLNIALALPDLKEGVEFANKYEARGSTTFQAQKIASLNPLVFNEFQKQIPFIITRGVIATTTKALLQHTAQQATRDNEILNILMTLGGMFYSISTTRADLRISTLMPSSFYALRIKNVEGEYKIFADNNEIAIINFSQECDNQQSLCVNQNHMVYIRNAQKNIFNQVIYSK